MFVLPSITLRKAKKADGDEATRAASVWWCFLVKEDTKYLMIKGRDILGNFVATTTQLCCKQQHNFVASNNTTLLQATNCIVARNMLLRIATKHQRHAAFCMQQYSNDTLGDLLPANCCKQQSCLVYPRLKGALPPPTYSRLQKKGCEVSLRYREREVVTNPSRRS